MLKKRNIAVIGSGIGGLAIAVRLANKGYHATVFEKELRPGGKISEIRNNGFRFDTGPSLFTLPELVDELIDISSGNDNVDFQYEPLKIICRYYYSGGHFIDAYQEVDSFAKEVERKSVDNRQHVFDYLKKSKTIYELTKEIFIFNDLQNIRNFLNLRTLHAVVNAWKLEPFQTLHQSNKKAFKDPRVVQLFDRYATYNGSNPYQAPATLKVIPHLEHNIGAFFPKKGMYSIVETLVSKAEKLGVKFQLGEEVKEVKLDRNKVEGIRTAKDYYPFDRVVADVDVFTFNKLLKTKTPVKPSSGMSSSAIIFYWGLKKITKELLLHNILFSSEYKKEFEAIFHTRTIFHDPTVYIFVSSKMVKGDAPDGHENWFVMINAPENSGQNWEEATNEARGYIIKKIKQMLKIDIEEHLVFEQFANPETIEHRTGSFHGSLYGLSSNNVWAAFKRHPNYLKSIKGLYFVGGSVHPGGGIPLCLASAKIVANLFPNLNHDQ